MNLPELDEIYRTYSGKVMGYITARVQRRADAEDLCADVFEKVYRKIDDYDQEKAKIGTWIFTITRNTVIDYFRKSKPTEELDENLPSEGEVDESILEEETLKEMAQALAKMPPELQNIIVLVYYRKHTLLEVSRMVHLSYRTVKLKHQKALRFLREALEPKNGEINSK